MTRRNCISGSLAALALIAASAFADDRDEKEQAKDPALPSWSVGSRVSLPSDWSSKHVIYSRGFTPAQAQQMKEDPRLYNSWALQGHVNKSSPSTSSSDNVSNTASPLSAFVNSPALVNNAALARRKAPPGKRDWSFSLGRGGVAQNMSPAKWNFNINSPVTATNCNGGGTAADFVIYGLNVAAFNGITSTVQGTFTGTGSGSIVINGVTIASSTTTDATHFQTNANALTEAQNLATAIGLNSTLNPELTTATGGTSSSATITLTAKTGGAAGTITATETSNNFSWGTITAGVDGQANIVALQNLYSGTSPTGLCGTAPTVKWAYNVTTLTNGRVTTSPILSLDGTQVAFIESNGAASVLHVLKWKDLDGSVAVPSTPTTVTSTVGCTTPCMVNLTYGASGTTNSSIYYDYNSNHDTAYVGNDNGQLFQITGVFFGTPTLSSSNGWSSSGVSVAGAATVMTGPVLDFNTNRLFVGGSDGKLYAVLTTAAGTQSSLAVGSGNVNGGGIVDSPLVDGSSGTVFASTASNALNVGGITLAADSNAVLVQANTSTPLGNPVVATIGQGTNGSAANANVNIHSGMVDNNYFTAVNTGHMYMCGTASAAASPTLYAIPFGVVTSIPVSSAGSGYTALPTLSINNTGTGGTGLVGTVVGTVNAATFTANTGSCGASRTNFATTFSGGTLFGGASAGTLTINTNSSSQLTSLTITNGSSYTARPTGIAACGPPPGAFSATLGVGSVSITNAGSGYGSAPTVTFTGGAGGSGAAIGTVTVSGTKMVAGTPATTNAISADTLTECSPISEIITSGIVSLSGVSRSGATITATSLTPNGFSTGDSVTIAGVTGAGACSLPTINKTATVTSTGTHTFTYSNAAVSLAALSRTSPSTTANVTTQTAHGLSVGDTVQIAGTAGNSTCTGSQIIGNFAVTGSADSTHFTYTSGGSTTIACTANTGTATASGTIASCTTTNATASGPGNDVLFYGWGLRQDPNNTFLTPVKSGNVESQDATDATIPAGGTSTLPVPTGTPDFQNGGTSAIVVDNLSVAAQAASIYFTARGVVVGASLTGIISSGTRSGGTPNTATITTTAAHGLHVGDTIMSSGTSPTGFSDASPFVITAVTTTTFQYVIPSLTTTNNFPSPTGTWSIGTYNAIKVTQTALQ